MTIQHKLSFPLANASLTGFLSNATGATWTLTTTATSDGLSHQVSVKNDSATDHSAKTAILTGTDADDKAQTETINLPGNGATVESTKYFKTLTSVVPSATIGADTMDIGWVDEAASRTIFLNHMQPDGALVHADLTGTANYTVQVSAMPREDYTAQAAAAWVSTTATALVGATASKIGVIEAQATMMRVILASYTDTAVLTVYVSEGVTL